MQSILENSKAVDNEKKSNKIFYLDFLRMIACLSVVMIHVSAEYVIREVGSFDFWIGNLFDSVSRAAVPLFVMISGALMLDENYVLTKQKWVKHISKMGIFFVVWSIVYRVVYKIFWGGVISGKRIDIFEFFGGIINGHYHLWFVPMIIGLYLLLPLLRLWVKRTNIRYVEYYLVLAVIFAFAIPHAMTLLISINPLFEKITLFENTGMSYCAGYTTYFILGWYLNNKEIENTVLFKFIFVIMILVAFFGTYGVLKLTNTDVFIFYNNFTVNVLMYSISIFVLSKKRYKDMQMKNSVVYKSVGLVTKSSLGIYAVHVAIISVLLRLFSGVHAILAVPLIFIICVVLSTLATMVIGKIPVLKKIV